MQGLEMSPAKLLEELRDVLWKANIECGGTMSEQEKADTFSVPLDEITGALATKGVLSDKDAKLLIALLDHFDPDDGYSLIDEIPDGLAAEAARIIEQLRSLQRGG